MTTNNPNPNKIKQTRLEAGLTQAQSAALLHTSIRSYQQWESGERKMHPAFFELFLLKTKQITLKEVLNADTKKDLQK